MLQDALNPRPTALVGPLGERMTLETLPKPGAIRWVPRRKAEIVVAVAGGLLTEAEAIDRYSLSEAELAGWREAHRSAGLPGLQTTKGRSRTDAIARVRPVNSPASAGPVE